MSPPWRWRHFYIRLCLPTIALQFGQRCVTSLQLFTQNGIKQHPSQQPNMHKIQQMSHDMPPLLYSTNVWTCVWHAGHCTVIGYGPKVTPVTITVLDTGWATTVVGPGAPGPVGHGAGWNVGWPGAPIPSYGGGAGWFEGSSCFSIIK